MIFCNYCKDEKEEILFGDKPDGTKYKSCIVCREKYCANRKAKVNKSLPTGKVAKKKVDENEEENESEINEKEEEKEEEKKEEKEQKDDKKEEIIPQIDTNIRSEVISDENKRSLLPPVPKEERKEEKRIIKRAYPNMPKHPILGSDNNSTIKIKKSSLTEGKEEENGLLMYGVSFMLGLFVGRSMK